jgi:hypothetical protein
MKSQAITLPLAFGGMPDEAPGLTVHQVENARHLLIELSITTFALVNQILASPAHTAACNKFAHDLKPGKHAKARSLPSLLLPSFDLKKASCGPLFVEPAKTC